MYTKLILIALFAITVDCQSSVKLPLGVFYETLCPDSINFIKYQLWPTVKDIGLTNIDLLLYPFGKASWTENGNDLTFKCQHGAMECKGNRIQACVKNSSDVSTTLSFVYCMESGSYPLDSQVIKKCAGKNDLNLSTINSCAGGDEGARLLKIQGEATKALDPSMTFVPWITLNGTHTDSIQNRALYDLKGLLCDNYPTDSKPSGCSN